MGQFVDRFGLSLGERDALRLKPGSFKPRPRSLDPGELADGTGVNWGPADESASGGAGTRLAPGAKEVSARNRNLDTMVPPSIPTLEPAPVRDLRGESDRAFTSGLISATMAALLGVRRGAGVVASTLRGASLGADRRFQAQTAATKDRNTQRLATYDKELGRFRALEQDATRRGNLEHESDQLAQQTAKGQESYMRSLAGLDGPALQNKLENDFRSGLHDSLKLHFGKREDGAWDVAPVVDPAQKTRDDAAKSLDDSRRSEGRLRVITSLAGLAPDGRPSAVAALAQTGELDRLGFNVSQDAETGAYQLDGVNLDELGKAPTGAWSPGAVTARSELERQRAYQRHGEDAQQLLQRFADSGRVSGPVRTELLDRVRVIGESLRAGKQIPAYVFELQPDSVAAMEPALRERLDIAREGLGLRRDQATETHRHNLATEADRDADRNARATRPSAALEAAQTRYTSLKSTADSHHSSERQAAGRAFAAQAKMKEIQNRPEFKNNGNYQNNPDWQKAFHEWQGADNEQTRFKNLATDSEKEMAKIEARWPGLSSAYRAGAMDEFNRPKSFAPSTPSRPNTGGFRAPARKVQSGGRTLEIREVK